jgi:CDP-diacylglycerol---serine O-phosphatidyltransferase
MRAGRPGQEPLPRRVRRRRRRGGEWRGFSHLLPHILTTGNLAAGFYSITLSASGQLDRAALALIFAGICDMLDGRVARMANATSRFGAEYDSIADSVSFGVGGGVVLLPSWLSSTPPARRFAWHDSTSHRAATAGASRGSRAPRRRA